MLLSVPPNLGSGGGSDIVLIVALHEHCLPGHVLALGRGLERVFGGAEGGEVSSLVDKEGGELGVGDLEHLGVGQREGTS